jgi:hypothetical protein
MPDTIQAIILLSVVVIPGFIALYIARELSATGRVPASDWELLFASLGFASIVLAAEVMLASAAALVFPSFPFLAGVRANELTTRGYVDTFSSHPARVAGIATGQYLFHCCLLGFLGWWDPAGTWIETRLRRRGFSGVDPWTLALIGLQQDLKQSATWVRVVLDSGVCYYGYVSKLTNKPKDDGTRDLVLQAFTRAEDRYAPAEPFGTIDSERTVVVLNTKNVVAVEGAFVDPYQTDDASKSS